MMRRIKNDGRSASLIITARTAPQNARVAWESDGMASVLLFFFCVCLSFSFLLAVQSPFFSHSYTCHRILCVTLCVT